MRWYSQIAVANDFAVDLPPHPIVRAWHAYVSTYTDACRVERGLQSAPSRRHTFLLHGMMWDARYPSAVISAAVLMKPMSNPFYFLPRVYLPPIEWCADSRSCSSDALGTVPDCRYSKLRVGRSEKVLVRPIFSSSPG